MNNRFLWLSIEALAVAAGVCSSFVETHIWSPAYSYFMLMLMVVLDLAAAWWLNQCQFRRRWLFYLPAYTAVLAFSHSFGKNEPGLVWLPQAVIGLIVLVHLRGLVVKFGKLQLIDADVATVLNTRLRRRIDEDAQTTATEVLSTPEPVNLPTHEAVPA
jgi:hypothetical protein